MLHECFENPLENLGIKIYAMRIVIDYRSIEIIHGNVSFK